MIKRVCSCGHIFKSDSNDNKCPSCRKWIEYICSHPMPEKRNIPGNIQFAFSESWLLEKSRTLLNTSMYGSFTIDTKDKTKFSIFIYLFNFIVYPKTDDMIKAICNTISHESLHESVYMNDLDIETTKKMDSSNLMKKLEEYL